MRSRGLCHVIVTQARGEMDEAISPGWADCGAHVLFEQVGTCSHPSLWRSGFSRAAMSSFGNIILKEKRATTVHDVWAV